ncbi:MAG: hypothetical protein Q8R37_05155, partial [Nanoarchaeota archaeon]|nr:hypothetical protein [Nanoarchaeota archaeon]
MRTKITALFEEVANNYNGKVTVEVDQGHDVHAFYRLTQDPSKVIHLQGYTGFSTEQEARIWGRMLSYNYMMDLRKSGEVSVGNEHIATIQG